MGLSIRTNVASLTAQKNVMGTQMSLESSMAKLASGYRIVRASDDAAGMAISSNLTAQVRSYNQALRNAQDGLSFVQTAEAALNETTNLLTRLRELAMQAASSNVGSAERAMINTESDQLISEITRISDDTKFNGTALISSATTFTFQVGVENAAPSRVSVTTADMDATALAVNATVLTTMTDAQAAIAAVDTAIGTVSTRRATFGAAANRMSSALATIATAAESLAAANSRIRDVDVASETANLTRSQILVQAGVSVLAQANQQPQIALKLLG